MDILYDVSLELLLCFPFLPGVHPWHPFDQCKRFSLPMCVLWLVWDLPTVLVHDEERDATISTQYFDFPRNEINLIWIWIIPLLDRSEPLHFPMRLLRCLTMSLMDSMCWWGLQTISVMLWGFRNHDSKLSFNNAFQNPKKYPNFLQYVVFKRIDATFISGTRTHI